MINEAEAELCAGCPYWFIHKGECRATCEEYNNRLKELEEYANQNKKHLG